jgi:aminoglycoside 6'-N-acetyltransferase
VDLPEVELRALRRTDFPLLARWLAEPLVARWWAHESTPEAVERDFGPSVDGADATAVYVGWAPFGGTPARPFGLVQVYPIGAYPEYLEELTPVCPVPPGALSIDYLVGEPDARGRGLGAGLIAAAVARGFADHPGASDVLVPVAAGNVASWRALERAGAREYAVGELTPDNPADPRDHVVHRFTRTPSPDSRPVPGPR